MRQLGHHVGLQSAAPLVSTSLAHDSAGEIVRGPAAVGDRVVTSCSGLGGSIVRGGISAACRLGPVTCGLASPGPACGNRFRGTLHCGQCLASDCQHHRLMWRRGRRRQLLGIVRGDRRQACAKAAQRPAALARAKATTQFRAPAGSRPPRAAASPDRSLDADREPAAAAASGPATPDRQEIVRRLRGAAGLVPSGLPAGLAGVQLLDELFGNEFDVVAKPRIGRQRADRILGRSLDGVGQPIHQPILLLGRTAGLFPQRPDAVPGLLPIDQVARSLVECLVDAPNGIAARGGRWPPSRAGPIAAAG